MREFEFGFSEEEKKTWKIEKGIQELYVKVDLKELLVNFPIKWVYPKLM